MASGSDWFSSVNTFSTFQATLERSHLIIKQSMALRMEKEIAALNEKYDGKKAAGLEEEVNAISDQSVEVGNYLSNVEFGLKRITDVRLQLLQAKDAIQKGSNSAYDLALSSMNSWVGRQSSDPDSIIANNGNNYGSWSADTNVVSGAGMTVILSHQFIGTDYALEFADGAVSRPEKDGTTMSGGPLNGVKMSDLSMNVDGDGNYFVTNKLTGVTEQVQVKRGGVGALNSWAYGDFARPTEGFDPSAPAPDPSDPAYADYVSNMDRYTNNGAHRDRAIADIDAAIRKLTAMERNLNSFQLGLSGIQNGLTARSSALGDEYIKVSEEELDAKQAERRAIEQRFNIATNAIALSNETTATFVYQMFNTSATTEKKDLTTIMLDAVTGGG